MKLVMSWRNLKDQTFDYRKIEDQLSFRFCYCVREEMGTFRWIMSLWKMLSGTGQDIVYVGEYGIVTILAVLHRFLTGASYRIVSMVDDSYDMISGDHHFSRRHKYAVKLLTPFIDEIQTVEPRVEQWYRENYGKGIFFPIIYDDTISLERLHRCIPISESYLQKYQLAGKKVVLFVGRLVQIKNVQFAIEAFLRAQIPNAVFVVVGSGDMEEELNRKYGELDNVKFVGRFEGDELYAWYNVAHIFTLPSLLEPFGAVTNEALVAGCKVLVSSHAGSNCLVQDGVNGYVIDPEDMAGYTEKLLELMQSVEPADHIYVKDNLMQNTFNEYFAKLYTRLEEL